MIWFTSDTHFSDNWKLKILKRPFLNVKEMDASIVEAWNSLVSPRDTVYHLGDVGNLEVLPKLQGNIHIIRGNHENYIPSEGLLKYVKAVDLHKIITIKDKRFLLIHKPYSCDKVSRRLYDYVLFGHIHGIQKVRKDGINVGVDVHHFRPISAEDILFYVEGIEKFYAPEDYSPVCRGSFS